eukprot:gene3066-3105_t
MHINGQDIAPALATAQNMSTLRAGINEALKVALKDPEFIKKQEALGAVVITDKRIDGPEHKKFVAAEIDKALNAALPVPQKKPPRCGFFHGCVVGCYSHHAQDIAPGKSHAPTGLGLSICPHCANARRTRADLSPLPDIKDRSPWHAFPSTPPLAHPVRQSPCTHFVRDVARR